MYTPKTEEERFEMVNEFAIEALAVLSKVLHAMILEHNITLSIFQGEIEAAIKKGINCPLKIEHK
jgi:hypothetical protein